MDWQPYAGLGSVFVVLLGLIWRVVRLGVKQDEALLAPAYVRIDRLEKRIEKLEEERDACLKRLAAALWTLRFNNLEVEEGRI